MVQRKGFKALCRRWDIFAFNGGRRAGENEVFVSTFFSEISDRIKAWEVFNLFRYHRDVVEVVIPSRMNNLGKRYGFARFSKVEDARVLGVRLDNIMIDVKKIHANVPRFESKLSNGSVGVKRGCGGTHQRVFVLHSLGCHMEVREGVSYERAVEAVNGGKKEMNSRLVDFVTQGGEKKRLAKAFIGVVLNPGSSYNMQIQFEVEGIFSIKVTPMSANFCLLEDVEEGFISELIGEGSTW